MTCRASLGPTTSSKATSVIQGAACCGPRAKRVSHSARCNAKALGNSSRAPQQRPKYSRPRVKPHLRSWCKKGSALLRIANGSACSAAPLDRRKRNSINCVKGGRHYSLQAQGDFSGIAVKCLSCERLYLLSTYKGCPIPDEKYGIDSNFSSLI